MSAGASFLITTSRTAFGRVPARAGRFPLRRNSSSLASWLDACLRTASTSQPFQS